MKHTLLSFIILVFCWTGSQAQVAINTNGANPATSSMLDISSTNKGMLMPRMASSQRKAILNPEPGLLVYDTDRQTIYLFDGQKWRPMMAATEETAPLVSRYPVGARQGSEFGAAADIYNTYVAVGAPSDSAQGVICGAVYIYSRENNNWQQKVKLSPPNATSGEHFGTAVCLFGDLLAVGAPGKTINGATSRGAVYLFKRNGEVWDFVSMLTHSGGAAYDRFGSSIAITSQYVAVGAPLQEHGGKTNAGGVHIFGQISGIWTHKSSAYASDPANEAKFGTSVGLQDSKLVVGAPFAPANFFNTPTNGGAVYVFQGDGPGFIWTFKQKLAPGQSHNNMEFGHSVIINNDEIYAGAPGYSGTPGWDQSLGVGMLFKMIFVNGAWQFTGGLQDLSDYNRMGESIALSNGVDLVIGMPSWNSGKGRAIVKTASSHYYVYDENPNVKEKYGTVVAAHAGLYIVTSPKSSPGRIFFGVVQ